MAGFFGDRYSVRRFAFYGLILILAGLTIKDVSEVDFFANSTDNSTFLNPITVWEPEVVMSAYQAIANLNSLERESDASATMANIKMFGHSEEKKPMRDLITKWLQVINDRNVTIVELTHKVGMEVMRRSRIQFTRVFFDSDETPRFHLRISWLSTDRFCFQPISEGENSKPIADQGDFLKMNMVHNPEAVQGKSSECMSVDFHGWPTPPDRPLEGKEGSSKDGVNELLCVGYIHELNVEVAGSYILLPNDDPAMACRNYENDESEFDCRSRCRMEMIRQMCSCTAQSLLYLADEKDLKNQPPCDYEKCDYKETTNLTDQLCANKCLPDCNQIRYRLRLDQKGRAVTIDPKTRRTLARTEYTAVTLIWGSFQYLELCQQYVMSFWTFLSNLGGAIGLWLGLSVLSLLQLLWFLTHSTVAKAQEATDKKRKPTMAANAAADYYRERSVSNGSEQSGANKPKISMNPFGGPVAKNPFESPFAKQPDQQKRSGAKESDAAQNPHKTVNGVD